ncbi:type II toxin-antitoxin system PemK/MazF family toxin [Pseudoxanthomonas daejeonensis]|jgi:mRNA interferase MazF|uniref:type II toxin-antitoxin system PemK/MazF family toxin n=1 Tax=Pseudoxanthomonas daejeonensis TaxID=266062 RepID=UPI001F5450CE|nr:type II toxin-antitoxin system PemK/MazF family toxin [Pseudoxanthomonas daejeonensis]UNK58370.1 type II toxin-antitoxin system PemK/MazF family toxin [Pseudoxanthomonas daejeonensis]
MMQEHGTAPRISYGDIFWVAADESIGSRSGSPHPHVVVQSDVLNHSRISTVVVCSLSSILTRVSEPGVVLLDAGEGGLERQSVVISSQVSSINKGRLGERIGSLSSQRTDQVIAALRFLQASHFRGR